MDLVKVGDFITKLRKEQRLTQTQLGDMVGVSDKTVYKWEKGISAPNISILNDLSRVLGVTTTELLNGEKLKKLNPNKIDETISTNIDFYTKLHRKNYQKKVYFGIIIIVLFFIIVIVIMFIDNNYDNFYIYELKSKDKNFKIEGIITLTPERDILTINSIENISNNEFDNIEIYTYEFLLKSGKEEIYKEGNISLYNHKLNDKTMLLNDIFSQINLYISENSDYNSLIKEDILSKGNLTIVIRYIDKKKENKEIELPLKFNKVCSNDKLIYDGGEKF